MKATETIASLTVQWRQTAGFFRANAIDDAMLREAAVYAICARELDAVSRRGKSGNEGGEAVTMQICNYCGGSIGPDGSKFEAYISNGAAFCDAKCAEKGKQMNKELLDRASKIIREHSHVSDDWDDVQWSELVAAAVLRVAVEACKEIASPDNFETGTEGQLVAAYIEQRIRALLDPAVEGKQGEGQTAAHLPDCPCAWCRVENDNLC